MSDEVSNLPPSPRPADAGSLVPYVLSLLILVGATYAGWIWWKVRAFEANRSQAIPTTAVGPPLTEFELTERSGEPFRTEDMKGNVWVATYFFTTCPGNCLRLNQNIQLMNGMPELKDVTWVSITCDPDTDTVKALADYADRYKADPERWLFCRGDFDYTRRVAAGMNLDLYRRGHKDYAVVIDKAGKIRGMFDAVSRSDCDRMRTMLIKLQAEEAPHTVASAATADASS